MVAGVRTGARSPLVAQGPAGDADHFAKQASLQLVPAHESQGGPGGNDVFISRGGHRWTRCPKADQAVTIEVLWLTREVEVVYSNDRLDPK